MGNDNSNSTFTFAQNKERHLPDADKAKTAKTKTSKGERRSKQISTYLTPAEEEIWLSALDGRSSSAILRRLAFEFIEKNGK